MSSHECVMVIVQKAEAEVVILGNAYQSAIGEQFILFLAEAQRCFVVLPFSLS
jgi:hypothetical protein